MKTSFVIVGLAMLIYSGIVFGEVLLDEKFDTNLNAWTLLNTPGAGGTVNVGLSDGKLNVSLTNNDRWRTQGVQSIARYPVPTEAGKKLVVDFYGVSTFGIDGIDTHSYPWSAVCFLSNVSAGCFMSWNPNWIAVKGWDASYGDWVQSSAIGYADLAGDNATTLKHTIITIDDANINVYIEDDYYENLSNPTSLYTTTASSIFSPEELEMGLYVVVGAARYTSWYTGTCTESFDGVRVSHIGYIPADCNEVNSMGYGFKGDVNRDCFVDFKDLSELAQLWLICVDPKDILCNHPWEN